MDDVVFMAKELAKLGKSRGQAARLIGVDYHSFAKICRDNSIAFSPYPSAFPTRGRSWKQASEMADKVAELYALGVRQVIIAELFHISVGRVSNICVERGVAKRGRSKATS